MQKLEKLLKLCAELHVETAPAEEPLICLRLSWALVLHPNRQVATSSRRVLVVPLLAPCSVHNAFCIAIFLLIRAGRLEEYMCRVRQVSGTCRKSA